MSTSPALEVAVPPTQVDGSNAERRIAGFAGLIFRDTPLSVPVEHVEQRARRALHVTLALVMLILLSPLMLLIAVLIKATSRGPVIYTQTRVGIDRRRRGSVDPEGRRLVDYGGKLFTIYKFRTMAADPAATLQIWATPNDPRITPVGRVLRAFRLDELPQLINVIRGDMNIVGPRPEQPNIVLRLSEQIDRYTERQRVLPGITGWAQINHHYDRSIEDVRTKLWYDLDYVNRHSLLRDIRILASTVPVILFQKGAW